MSPEVQAALIAAIVGALITGLGWIVTHRLTLREQSQKQRQEVSLDHLRRQIEELYGPLLGLIQRVRIVHEIAASSLPTRDNGSIDTSRFQGRDSDTYGFFVHSYFLPINAEIASLLRTKAYLLEEGDVPESYVLFLEHQAQFECLDRLWRDMHIDSRPSNVKLWPARFENDVASTLKTLGERYTGLRQRPTA